MKAKLFIVSLVSICLQATSAMSANYVCESEYTSALHYQGGWRANAGTYDYDKFLVSDDDGQVTFSAFGNKSSPYFSSFECQTDTASIMCNSFFGQFRLSKISRRYLSSYTVGYWDGEDNNDNTPNITIGSCAEM